jgi:hypothetical protein
MDEAARLGVLDPWLSDGEGYMYDSRKFGNDVINVECLPLDTIKREGVTS